MHKKKKTPFIYVGGGGVTTMADLESVRLAGMRHACALLLLMDSYLSSIVWFEGDLYLCSDSATKSVRVWSGIICRPT